MCIKSSESFYLLKYPAIFDTGERDARHAKMRSASGCETTALQKSPSTVLIAPNFAGGLKRRTGRSLGRSHTGPPMPVRSTCNYMWVKVLALHPSYLHMHFKHISPSHVQAQMHCQSIGHTFTRDTHIYRTQLKNCGAFSPPCSPLNFEATCALQER